jgi:hypothetical protein
MTDDGMMTDGDEKMRSSSEILHKCDVRPHVKLCGV